MEVFGDCPTLPDGNPNDRKIEMDDKQLETLRAHNAALEEKLRLARAESARWFAHAIALDKIEPAKRKGQACIQARELQHAKDEESRARRKRKWDCRLLPELHSREFQIGQKLVSCLNVQHVKIGSQLNAYQSFMRYLPARLGSNHALASATACVNSAYLDFVARKPELSVRSRKLYGSALSNLRKMLLDQEKASSSEGLCAAFLLVLYEVMNGTFKPEHLRGIAAMIRTYGLEGYKDELGMTLVVFLFSRLIIQSLHDRKTCFLAEEKWVNMLRSARANEFCVCDQFEAWMLLAQVGSFLSTTVSSIKQREAKEFDILLARGRILRHHLKAFYSTCLPLLKDEVLNAGEHSVSDACRALVGVFAVMTLAVNLVMGKLHKLLGVAPGPDVQKMYDDEARVLALLVQKTSTYAHTLGPFVDETVSMAVEVVTDMMDEMNTDFLKRNMSSESVISTETDATGSSKASMTVETSRLTDDSSTSTPPLRNDQNSAITQHRKEVDPV